MKAATNSGDLQVVILKARNNFSGSFEIQSREFWGFSF